MCFSFPAMHYLHHLQVVRRVPQPALCFGPDVLGESLDPDLAPDPSFHRQVGCLGLGAAVESRTKSESFRRHCLCLHPTVDREYELPVDEQRPKRSILSQAEQLVGCDLFWPRTRHRYPP